MAKVFLIAWVTFKDGIRNKALHGIFGFGGLLFLANVLVTGMFTWELGKVAVDVGMSVVSFAGLLIIFFFSIHMVTNDLEKKTIYMVLSRPVGKAQYVLGKYAGLGLLVLLSCAVLGLCSALSVKVATSGAEAFIPANFSWPVFFLGLGFLVLSLLVMTAVALVWVTVTTHPFTAVLLSIFSYFVGQNMENVRNIITASKAFRDNAVLIKTIDTITWVFPNLAAFDLKTTAAYGLPLNAATVLWTALYGASYIGACLVIAALIFRRRELA